MGCEHLQKDGTCKADPNHRRCLNIPRDFCKEHFKYKKIGQATLA